MNKFLSSVQSFIHSVTTNDHYASYESTVRAKTHESLNQDPSYSPNGIGGTDRGFNDESRVVGNLGNSSSSSIDRLNQNNNQNNSSSTSLNRIPYTPGMKSSQVGNGGIPLQDYADGTPPPPAPKLSWKRIDRWIEIHYPELDDQMSYGVTAADLNELEADLDCTLPLDVRDSYMIHDGQERGGKPTGLFFGITILDLEGIVEEWAHWKNTAIRLNNMVKQQQQQQQQQQQNAAGPSSRVPPQHQQLPPPQKNNPKISWLYRQESVPDGAVQKVYAHPGWIPLAKDYEGNNIGIDLAPSSKGRWGQVIIFGRDFDRKYVIAPSWGSFLSMFADDLENGDHFVDEDLDNGALLFRAPNGKIVPYFDVLRSRVDRSIRQQHKQKQQQQYPQPSAAAASRRKDTSRPQTPQEQRKVSSASASSSNHGDNNNTNNNNLISPMHSSTNLPSTGLSTSSNHSAKNSLDTNRSNENEGNGESNKGKSRDETATAKDDDVDEVDMLKDDLTEVEI